MRHMHTPMQGWACINAILEFAGEADAMFGEFRASIGDAHTVDPVETARKIIAERTRHRAAVVDATLDGRA